MLTAAAVAVAITVVSMASWLLVRERLYQELNDSLSAAPRAPLAPPDQTELHCGTTPAEALANVPVGGGNRLGPQMYDYQFVLTDGTVCLLGDATRAIQVVPGDNVLLPHGKRETYRAGNYLGGDDSAQVRRTNITVKVNGMPQQAVLLTALPTHGVQKSLSSLALLMTGVAGLGVVGAGIAGRVVARSALKPVDQLTDAVEHIARTEEVGATIPVNGSDEITRLSTSFNSMSTALANSRERQTRLIADAGHELRTPLTSLRTNVDLLIRSDQQGRALPPETRARMLGNMKAQMQELTVLIGDLLQLSRPDTPNPEAVRTVVPFHETVARALERGRLRGPALTFVTEVNPWYVHGDPAALERAVINLLDNAVKYSPPSGTVEVRLRAGRLTVRDHGPGIPTDELPFVFDRFWRSPSSRQLPGSGLGLSIVAQSVRDAGGQVSLGPATDGGPGTQAVMVLPGQPDDPR
ncbi:cell wall metabolism sensor histidine kinase WalK [Kitasatospora sp. CB02891]|uniref:sensor histidine kinase n=1 Tax=Kitasatospora sp. CB02891 TaxID=2020329 RepID=UPI000C27A8E6|nr:HAMP domain-containing sensor histidine kinase [Kitasatospora sp. CB02891]PJN24220.1 two-component sensor histidine kinase [Kitasatospora sp. CB02891]